jgi:hypothetical protein
MLKSCAQGLAHCVTGCYDRLIGLNPRVFPSHVQTLHARPRSARNPLARASGGAIALKLRPTRPLLLAVRAHLSYWPTNFVGPRLGGSPSFRFKRPEKAGTHVKLHGRPPKMREQSCDLIVAFHCHSDVTHKTGKHPAETPCRMAKQADEVDL